MLAKGNRSKIVVKKVVKNIQVFTLVQLVDLEQSLAANNIKDVKCIDYPELGMEAIWKIKVENFPAFLIIDDKGNDFYSNLISHV